MIGDIDVDLQRDEEEGQLSSCYRWHLVAVVDTKTCEQFEIF